MTDLLINTGVAIATGLAGWLAGRRKSLAETHITEMDAVEKAISVWRTLSEDLQRRYEQVVSKVDTLEKELDGLRDDNQRLRRENKDLMRQLKTQTNA